MESKPLAKLRRWSRFEKDVDRVAEVRSLGMTQVHVKGLEPPSEEWSERLVLLVHEAVVERFTTSVQAKLDSGDSGLDVTPFITGVLIGNWDAFMLRI